MYLIRNKIHASVITGKENACKDRNCVTDVSDEFCVVYMFYVYICLKSTICFF